MRLIKTTLAFLIFFLILACGQNPERQARNSNNDTPVTRMPEAKPEVLQKSEETEEDDENSVSNDSTEATKNQAQNEPIDQGFRDVETLGDIDSTDQSSGWDWWMVGAITSLVFNFLILSLLAYVIGRKKYHIDRKEHYKERKEYYKNKFEDLEKTINKSRSQKEVRPPNTTRVVNDRKFQRKNSTIKESNPDQERAVEIALSVNPTATSGEQKANSKMAILFAEKASENKVFTSVSEQKNEYKSIFKLILDNSESEEAKFEVLDSDYILKMVVNSPDTYLYPVCKPENSNQNYSGEIITTKKGIAHKVDGKWIVKEENKATIKFQ